MSEQKHTIAAYAAYLRDDRELLECASGGVATALARAVIRAGGYVAGVAYTADFMEAQYTIVNTEEGLAALKGSKYIDAEKGTVYKDVQALLDQGERVLFFGLPCVVAALKTVLKREYDNLLAVELICHGPTDRRVHRQYVEHLVTKYQSPLTAFSVKRKKNGWTPGYLYAAFENGQVFEQSFYTTEYGYAFRAMAKKPCYACTFRGDARCGDLMIGDFWGAVESDPFWNKNGVSSVLVHTEKGLAQLRAVEELALFETTAERIIEKNPSVVKPRAPRPETAKFTRLFEQRGLFAAVKGSKSWKMRLKSLVKSLLKR